MHELGAIKRLVVAGTIVIACSGDGAPRYDNPIMGCEDVAAVDFVHRTGGRTIITDLGPGRQDVRGEAGTTITAEKA